MFITNHTDRTLRVQVDKEARTINAHVDPKCSVLIEGDRLRIYDDLVQKGDE